MYTAIDTETELAGNRNPIPRLACVSFANDHGVLLLAADDPRLFDLVVGCLADGAVFANAPFDLFVLWRQAPALWPYIRAALEAGRIADVLTREKYLDIAEGFHRLRGGYNLGAVAARRAGLVVNKSDPWRRRYGALIEIPIKDWPVGAKSYAQWDAYSTWRIFKAQEDARYQYILHQIRDLFVDAPRCARAHVAFYSQTIRGIHTDPVRVAALDALLSERIRKLEARALEAGLARYTHKIKRPSPVKRYKAAAQAMLRELGVELVINPLTDAAAARGETEGSISLSKAALEIAGIPRGRWGDPKKRPGEDPTVLYDKAASPAEPAAATLLAHPIEVFRELGGTRALYSKNIPVLRHPVIRTRFDELVASARVSSSGFKRTKVEDADDVDEEEAAILADFDCELADGDEFVGTNFQNWPREGGMRECLVPPPADEWARAAL